MCVCRIACARRRQSAAGSSCVPKTTISPGSSPPWRRVAYAVSAASPEPTIATLAIAQSSPSSCASVEEHRVRPEERRRRRAPLVDPGPPRSRGGGGGPATARAEAPSVGGVRARPTSRLVRAVVLVAVLELREPEERRQEQPLAAAVEDVVGMTVHAAAGREQAGTHALDDPVRAPERATARQSRLASRRSSAQPEVDDAAMPQASRPASTQASVVACTPVALLPPVHARLLPLPLEVVGRAPAASLQRARVDDRDGRSAPRPPRARAPSRRAVAAASRCVVVARRRAGSGRRSRRPSRTIRAAQSKNASALSPLADAGHRVGDERPVAEPAEAVDAERRARRRTRPTHAGPSRMISSDRWPARRPRARRAHLTEPASSPWTK